MSWFASEFSSPTWKFVAIVAAGVVLCTAVDSRAEVHVITASVDEIVIDYRYGVFEIPRPGRALDRSTVAAKDHCAKYNRDAMYDSQLSLEKHRVVSRFRCVNRDAADVALKRFADKYRIEQGIDAAQRDTLRALDAEFAETYLLMLSERLPLVPGPSASSKQTFAVLLDAAHRVAKGVDLGSGISGGNPQERMRSFVRLVADARTRHGSYNSQAILEVLDVAIARDTDRSSPARRQLNPLPTQ